MKKSELLLLAALKLSAEPGGETAFSAEALIVKAWQLFPEAFALAGYPHPDSNAVICILVGKRGLVRHGWLEKVAPKMYRLTADGRTVAASFSEENK